MKFFKLSFWVVITMFASVFLFSDDANAISISNNINFYTRQYDSTSFSQWSPIGVQLNTGFNYIGRLAFDTSGTSHNMSQFSNKFVKITSKWSWPYSQSRLPDSAWFQVWDGPRVNCVTTSISDSGYIEAVCDFRGVAITNSFSFGMDGQANKGPILYRENSNVLLTLQSLDFTVMDDTASAIQDQTNVLGGKLDSLTQSQNQTNQTITNSDSSGASGDAGNFFSGFQTNTHGLTGIITAPLNLIQSITNQTCNSLGVPLPFVNQNLTLPCMSEIYQSNFGPFLILYQTITTGFIGYWVVVRIFALIKDFKNPDHDEVEVLDL